MGRGLNSAPPPVIILFKPPGSEPMNLGRLASSIAESPTLKLNALAKSMQAQGIPVIHLGGGEPKNKAPRSAVDAAAAYLTAGDVKYTPSAGTPSLRKAAAEYTENNY